MIRLDNVNTSLEIVLAGAITTTQPQVTVGYSTKTSTAYTGSKTTTATNSTTNVTLVAAPAASAIIDVDYISVLNRDTVSVTFTIQYNVSSTRTPIARMTLASGDMAVYVHGSGWSALDSSGNTKTVLAGTFFGGFANPTASVGLTTVNGVAVTAMRSDAAPALSQSIVPTWTGVHTYSPTIAANTSADGIVLSNSTAATSGNQRYSPRTRFTGQGWQTGTGTSQTVDWICENRPVQGATNPSTNFAVASQINGGGYVDKLVLTSGAVLSLNNNSTVDPTSQSLGFFPSFSLVGNDTDNPAFEFHSWGGKANFISPVMAGGTAVTPTASPGATNILVFGARGYTGSAYSGTKASVAFTTVNTWSGTDNSTKITFNVTPTSSTTLTTAITIDGTGITIGSSDPGGSDQLRVNGALTINSATLIQTKTAFTDGAGASAGTLANAPAVGNPTKWIPINDNGTIRYIPAW